MMVRRQGKVPEFAVIGHPNEGKSSVLSTLAEDDSVRISPLPGETRSCQTYSVMLDGREIIRFTDTPGFQNPRKTLQWMESYRGPDDGLIEAFLHAHGDDPDFSDDCQLLQPLLRGAGVIFVVDGSRPLRQMDRAEMEILRLTGCPRMAIINCKGNETDWLERWQAEFRKHFNSIRTFNSRQATYRERIELLESLKGIDQELQAILNQVVEAFKDDWQQRNVRVAELLMTLLEEGVGYSRSRRLSSGVDVGLLQEKMHRSYEHFLRGRERRCQAEIRALYRHNIFRMELPVQSILQEDLFGERTWKFLGLNSSQLVMAGALSGAALGAGLDVAVAGLSFGIFSGIGAVLGAAGTVLKGERYLAEKCLLGVRLDAQQYQVGPVRNIQLLYVLLDRQLLFYSHCINWAHGRRETESSKLAGGLPVPLGYTREWSPPDRAVCERFFVALQRPGNGDGVAARVAFSALIRRTLEGISESR